MRPDKRIVAKLPLTTLWDESGQTSSGRLRALGYEEIAHLLRAVSLRFMIADCGEPLRWIPEGERFVFWKSDVKPHLVEPAEFTKGVHLDDLSNCFFYIASEWHHDKWPVTVLLEKHH